MIKQMRITLFRERMPQLARVSESVTQVQREHVRLHRALSVWEYIRQLQALFKRAHISRDVRWVVGKSTSGV